MVDLVGPGYNVVTEAKSALNMSVSGQVKAGAGVITSIFCASSSSATCKIWDALTATTPVLVNTFTLVGGTPYPMCLPFATGCYITITGTADITVAYA